MAVVRVALVVIAFLAAATLGRRFVRDASREKLKVARMLDSHQVVLSVTIGEGTERRAGRLIVDSNNPTCLVLVGEDRERLIFLSQIRSLEDLQTGASFGGNGTW